MQDYLVQYETDQNLTGYVPCRYRVTSVALRACPTLWDLHSFFLSLSFSFMRDELHADTFCPLGCPRPHLRPRPDPEGKEACTTKEGQGQEGCQGIGVVWLDCSFVFSSCSRSLVSSHMFSCLPRLYMPPLGLHEHSNYSMIGSMRVQIQYKGRVSARRYMIDLVPLELLMYTR